MIEIIESFPDNVVGLVGKGQVTKDDYEQVLIPKVEAALRRHNKIRLYEMSEARDWIVSTVA